MKINPEKYQVFLLSNPSRLLLFTHPWFVVNRKGVVSRWAIGRGAINESPRWGWINKNALPPFSGVPFFLPFGLHWPRWKPTILGCIEGEENSLAARMAEAIERSPELYPYRDIYKAPGPNCNTYIQWFIDSFPESGFRLPWNAVGKGYEHKRVTQSST